MSCAHDTTATVTGAPFEGPEKLLEIWFAPSIADLPGATSAVANRLGLRKVERSVWEDMLSIVKCKVLSFVEGTEIDAYLLRLALALSIYHCLRILTFRPQRVISLRICPSPHSQNMWYYP
jgi:hypothetical protein